MVLPFEPTSLFLFYMRNSGEPVSLEGVLERIVFFNEENCFCIASLRPSDPSYRESVTVSGIMPASSAAKPFS